MSTSSSPVSAWLGRAVVEGVLIVFAVVLGFVVNEWRETVADRQAAEDAMVRVAAEIEDNIAQLEAVVVYHEGVVALISDRLDEIESGDGPVRGHRQNDLPAWIAQGSDQSGRLMPEPPGGGDHADPLSQPRFDPARARFLDHDDKGLAFHLSSGPEPYHGGRSRRHHRRGRWL